MEVCPCGRSVVVNYSLNYLNLILILKYTVICVNHTDNTCNFTHLSTITKLLGAGFSKSLPE